MKKAKAVKAAKRELGPVDKKVVALRAKGLSYRAIDQKLGHDGNGSWALFVARRAGVA